MEEMVKERETDEMVLEGDDDENSQANKYLLYNIGEEVYGISIVSVTEIIEMQKVTEVPDMPDYVKGVINLRGRVIPVMDLRLRFGMEERAHDDRTCIIIADVKDNQLGFIVDTVAEVQDILEKDIEPPPNFKSDAGRNQYLAGLGKIGDKVTILIDVKRILQEREIETITKNLGE
jgi:purine-binding chemotaxis protein CheW